MEQLENKKENNSDSAKQQKQRKSEVTGLASTFNQQEVKNLFSSYLTTMLVVEVLIFFFCFINHLATDSYAFPWKPYLFATFITPIAITFVFGLILLTFNRFFFKESNDNDDDFRSLYPRAGMDKGVRITTFLQIVHRLPFLFSMFLLIAATALAYKMDDIVLYTAQAGAVTARYLFFALIGILIMAAIGLAVWMILSYRLRRSALTTGHQYRMQLMEQFGMVLLEDGTMIDKDGNIVYQQDIHSQITYNKTSGDVQRIEEIKEDE